MGGVPRFDWSKYSLPIIDVPVDQNREPRDMPEETHKIINQWFQKKSGIKFRSSSIFGTGNYEEAKRYADEFTR